MAGFKKNKRTKHLICHTPSNPQKQTKNKQKAALQESGSRSVFVRSSRTIDQHGAAGVCTAAGTPGAQRPCKVASLQPADIWQPAPAPAQTSEPWQQVTHTGRPRPASRPPVCRSPFPDSAAVVILDGDPALPPPPTTPQPDSCSSDSAD